MSFILDALKKAESERNRSNGPVLMDVRIAPPRRRLPAWAWIFGAILVANLGVLAWLMLRDPVQPPIEPTPAAVAPVPVAPVTVAPVTPPPAPSSAGAVVVPAPPPLIVEPVSEPDLVPPARTTGTGRLPSAAELRAAGVPLPPLQLNLHAYDPDPAHRYVLLNATRLREGEFTPDGIKVEQITPRGVVLEASGRRFELGSGY